MQATGHTASWGKSNCVAKKLVPVEGFRGTIPKLVDTPLRIGGPMLKASRARLTALWAEKSWQRNYLPIFHDSDEIPRTQSA